MHTAVALLIGLLAVPAVQAAPSFPHDARAEPRRELVVIDGDVLEPELLLRALDVGDPTRSLELIRLEPGRDGLTQVGAVLAGRTGIDALHLLSHGEPGGVTIGTTFLDARAARGRAAELRRWRTAFEPGADLLIYGCRTGRGPEGERLLRTLAELIGVDVAGSAEPVGNSRNGGDWRLGVRVGRIETHEAVGASGRVVWPGLLAVRGDDAFVYTPGALAGNNGGSGWSNAWGAGNVNVVVATLNEPGGILRVSGGATQLAMPSGGSRATTISARNLTSSLGADGTTTWVSILLQPDRIATSDDYAGVNLGTGLFSRLFFGYSTGSLRVETYGLGGASSLATPAATGQTVFLVLKVEFLAGNDRATLYLNPTPGLAAPDSTDVAIKTDLNINGGSAFTQFAFAGGQAASAVNGAQIDELRVGDTFADVAPVLCPGGVVTTTADSATGGALRACIILANENPGADTISLPAGNYVLGITGSDDTGERGDLDITESLTIVGAGAASSIIDGGGLDRVLDVRAGVADISGVTIRGGDISNKGGGIRNIADLTLSNSVVTANNAVEGGGIHVESAGATLVLDDVTLVLNTADRGAGLRVVTDGASATLTDVTFDRNVASNLGGGMSVEQADASLVGVTFKDNDADTGAGLWTKATTTTVDLTNVTFSGNDSTGEGGAIWAEGDSLSLDNVTIAGNTASIKGGGIRPKAGTVTFSNTIIAGNSPDNCERAVTSAGNNIDSGVTCALPAGESNIDPLLGALQDNGGPTWTRALLTGSPAIDAGATLSLAVDQRGVTRPQDGDGSGTAAWDIGAYEATLSLQGTVFEDVNYGGGLGRDLATAAADAPSFTVGRGNVTVELYDAAGNFIAVTTTAVANGSYGFSSLAPGLYTVRVVNATVTSARPGSNGSELGLQTYRIDGDGEAVGAGARKVGGEFPANEDAAANSGAQMLASLQGTDLDTDGVLEWTQSIVEVDLSGGVVVGVDFGFNFSTIVNTNDAGQGSLRQFILNSNLLN